MTADEKDLPLNSLPVSPLRVKRRTLLQAALAAALPLPSWAQQRRFEPKAGGWRGGRTGSIRSGRG